MGIYEQDLKLRIKISYESLLVFTKPLANVLLRILVDH
jgi:hypothetical protein